MNRKGVLLAAALALGFGGAANAAGLTLTSPDIKDGATIQSEQVFAGFGCTGKNVSPALAWSGAPSGTKSFALTAYDPDAPTGSGWWHWVVFNMPANATELVKDAGAVSKNLAPKGTVQSRTDFGTPGWGGPCPPQGDKPHHYIFTVYALDVDHLDADANASAAYIGFNLHFHTLAKASFTGLYGR
ncbi:MAG TPA: YbhB/YbcL family Raf kinase inhibitor-like protein [Stellaceae bacterium]|nr:YbhB/YbcL family Raf kinase inhibitor-like protein [Stellaceae bacterium]